MPVGEVDKFIFTVGQEVPSDLICTLQKFLP